jgi:hypothetical protein
LISYRANPTNPGGYIRDILKISTMEETLKKPWWFIDI